MNRNFSWVALPVLLAACTQGAGDEGVAQRTQNVDQGGYLLFTALGTAEVASVDQLATEVGLDADIASAIVAYRSGPDGIEGTADDGDGQDDRADGLIFDSHNELDDAVPGVTWATFGQIRDYHVARVVETLNAASVDELENMGIDGERADQLESWRFGDDGVHGTEDDQLLTSLTDVEIVWPHSNANEPLASLAAYHLAQMPDAACGALWLANHASEAMLDGPIGLYSNAAASIVLYRAESSIDSVSELDAVPDVGAAMIQNLRQYAAAHGFDSPAFCAQSCAAGDADPVVLLSEDFVAGDGWTLDSTWEIGQATRSYDQIYGWYGDPGLDHSRSHDQGVVGVVIGGNAPTDLHGMYYLTSPVLDASAVEGALTLSYARWLNSDYTPYMKSAVEVFDGSAWVRLWESEGYPGVRDRDWTKLSHDISAYKNDQLQVRFGFEITSFAVFDVGSWNIDDVVIVSGASCE
jgi:hypothetical protein